MKKLVALLMCLMLLPLLPAMAEEADMLAVYASVPADWSWPCVWAWNAEGENAFAAWPGEMMEPDPANEGWYYIYLPAGMESVIINANDGAVQTDEVRIDRQAAWITVAEDKTAAVSFEALTTGARLRRALHRLRPGGRLLGEPLPVGLVRPRRQECLPRLARPRHEAE